MNSVSILSVRTYRNDDLDDLRHVIHTTIEQSYSGTYSPEAVEFFMEYHSIENIHTDALLGHSIVVLKNGSIVGTGTLLGKNIRRVFVLPCHQGKGIGGRIMTELELKAKYDHVDIFDLDSSMVSVEFYHRLGYTGDDHAFIELRSGGMLDYVPMTKKVCLP